MVGLEALRAKVSNLTTALESNSRIGIAVGIIMATYELAEDQAFAILQDLGHAQNRALHEVADDVILTRTVEQAPGKKP